MNAVVRRVPGRDAAERSRTRRELHCARSERRPCAMQPRSRGHDTCTEIDHGCSDPTRPTHRYRSVTALDRSGSAEIVIEHAIDQAARHEDPDLHLERARCPTLVVASTGGGIEAPRQCTACVERREVTDGNSWFCSDHARPGRMRLTELLPSEDVR